MHIGTEIELSDNTLNDNTFTVNCFKTWKEGFFTFQAIEECEEKPRIFNYEMIASLATLKYNSITRYAILTYCLGKFTSKDEVTLKDIFMHANYIKRF